MPSDFEVPSRWPRSVYADGEEPDPRFSLANERTFLAWLRTALALIAGGVALEMVSIPAADALRRSVSVAVMLLGVAAALHGWRSWARAESALRRRQPLSGPGPALLVGLGVAAAGLVLGVGVALGHG